MSERRPAHEMTDPGPPPEEALDATLRALGAPVPAQTRRTPESAGLDAAHYHAEPHRLRKAHEPASSSKVSTTQPMVTAQTPPPRHDTVPFKPREQRPDLATVPRAAPAPSRMSTFLAALAFVVVVLGVATWAVMRRGSPPERPAAMNAAAATPGRVSAEAVVVPAPAPPPATAALAVSNANSSATIDPPRPTGRPQPTSTPGTAAAGTAAAGTAAAGTAAAPRRLPTDTTSAAPAPFPPSAVATAPVAPPAPTTKYNHLLREDKQ
jgi:hypothetical protein